MIPTFICRVGNEPAVPSCMLPADGCIPEGRVQGTAYEKLCEIAGRVCYDSLAQKKSRNSPEYHEHIRVVGHLSVVEHAYFTVRISAPSIIEAIGLPVACLNRPSLYFCWEDANAGRARITLNLRHVLEWMECPRAAKTPIARVLNLLLKQTARLIAPQIVTEADVQAAEAAIGFVDPAWTCSLVQPNSPHETHLSVLLSGSRGMSHEWVRHKVYSAISQRSTRYVDESESPWVHHPLIRQYLAETQEPGGLDGINAWVIEPAQRCYAEVTDRLQAWLITRGVDKFTARKQARGAARGYLGNALETELVYTASESMWEHIFRMRASEHADAEIREVAVAIWKELVPHSPYLASLFTLAPSPDGIGEVLACVSSSH